MTQINSFKDRTVWQVSLDLAELIRRRKLVPEPLLTRGVVLIEPIGKMLHGLAESSEVRMNADKG